MCIMHLLMLLYIAILPTNCSRHNTPSRSHAITNFIKTIKGTSANLLIYLATKDITYTVAQSCAIARAFPTFTKKTNNSHSNTIITLYRIIIDSPELITLSPEASQALLLEIG